MTLPQRIPRRSKRLNGSHTQVHNLVSLSGFGIVRARARTQYGRQVKIYVPIHNQPAKHIEDIQVDVPNVVAGKGQAPAKKDRSKMLSEMQDALGGKIKRGGGLRII